MEKRAGRVREGRIRVGDGPGEIAVVPVGLDFYVAGLHHRGQLEQDAAALVREFVSGY